MIEVVVKDGIVTLTHPSGHIDVYGREDYELLVERFNNRILQLQANISNCQRIINLINGS